MTCGDVHLTAVCLLAPHLTQENCKTLLDAAKHRSKREVEVLVARIAPRPDVPTSVRKLPARTIAVPTPTAAARGSALVTGPALRDERGTLLTALPLASAADRTPNAHPSDDKEGVPASGRATEAVAPAGGEGGPGTPPCAAAVSASLAEAVAVMLITAEGGLATSMASAPMSAPAPMGASNSVCAVQPTSGLSRATGAPGVASALARRPAILAPLSPERYKLQVTIGTETLAKLRHAQDLMRHAIPDGDVAVVLDRALTLLVTQLEKQKAAATERPRAPKHAPGNRSGAGQRSDRANGQSAAEVAADTREAGAAASGAQGPGDRDRDAQQSGERQTAVPPRAGASVGGNAGHRRSRYIPAAVRRAVWARDHGQCVFIGHEGRCGARARLEYHHVVPFARGGQATVDGLALRCQAHNLHEAERDIGADQVRKHARRTLRTIETVSPEHASEPRRTPSGESSGCTPYGVSRDP